MHIALPILVIVATVIVVTGIADRLRSSAPLLLMVVGIAASFVPGLDVPRLGPELVLVGFLPPLLYSAAIRTSIIDFRLNRRSIGFLSVLLVLITALGVGLLTWILLPVPFAVAFALGAVVAPPDAVAATSIARRVGLPRRLVTILEGESLVNDATAITCLRLALLAIGTTITVGQVVIGFLVAAGGGALVGIVVGFLVARIRRRITQPVFDTAISLMVPFAAYLPAEELGVGGFHGSGVIAVVVAGLILGHQSPVIQSGRSRLSERVNWATIQFLLQNSVFLLIGLQARRLLTDVGESDLGPGRIVGFCLAVLFGVMILRLVWVALAGVSLFRRTRTPDEESTVPPWAATIVIGWAGLRGVVTLATAFLIPADAPYQSVLVFAALVVAAGTLLIQGVSLPWLVRRLGLRGPDARSDALQAATLLQSSGNAALVALDDLKRPTDSAETLDLLRDRISRRSDGLWERLGAPGDVETPAEQYRRLRLATLQVERDEVLRLRSSGTLDHDVIETVLASFDVEESMLSVATERSDTLNEATVFAPGDPGAQCQHLLDAAIPSAPTSSVSVSSVKPGSGQCEDCVREGTSPVHLRICLTCGRVGCCDSSVGRHAERHFHQTRHPVMQSFEPHEAWRWCYLDEQIG